MAAASPAVGLVCEGASQRLLCHGLGRMVNNLTKPSRGFSLSVSTPLLFASRSQIIRAHYHLIQAEWSSHYHLLSAENDDVIKQTLRCNQVATRSRMGKAKFWYVL